MSGRSTPPLDGPGEISLRGDAQGATGSDDAEQDAGALSAFGAAGEEHDELKLRDVLELALSGRIVDGYERIIDEAEERGSVILVVGNRRRQRFGRQERWLDGIESALKVAGDGADVLLPMLAERVSA